MRGGLPGLLALLLLTVPASAPAASPFADWAAAVVAGDYRAANGEPSEVFDNARRDVVEALVGLGFRREHIRQFSVRPGRYPDAGAGRAAVRAVSAGLTEAAARARSGCLVYVTSHGSRRGALVGSDVLTPEQADEMLISSCGARPTVVVISACFSGVYVPTLAGPNRLILTAARSDRTSFGCSEEEVYPYFDSCILSSLPRAEDFAQLGRQARACVEAKERAADLSPASEPQMSIGPAIKAMLPALALR